VRGAVAAALLALVVGSGALGASASGESPEIAAMRADLEAARFEAVISAASSWLARPDLSQDDLAAALRLRAQARVGLGELPKAEEDWRRLLAIDPEYAPDPLATGRKARERFDKLQAAVVGTVRFVLDPPEAVVTAEGKLLRIPADGTVRLPVGTTRLSVASPGFDGAQIGVDVVAGRVTPVEVRLVPNARKVVVRTDPEGVEVWFDGNRLGTTRRDAASGATPAGIAALELDPLPIGEYVLELRKECYRTTRLNVLVNVDVLDRSPIQMAPVLLGPARAAVTFAGGTPGAEILWGGESVATLPTEGPVALCAGSKLLEARASGRAVWRGSIEIPEEGALEVDVAPRPNAAIFGAERWPAELEPLSRSFGWMAGLPLPERADLATPGGWESVVLPPDTDLAVAIVASGAPVATSPRVYVFSPWLGTVTQVTQPPDRIARPAWSKPLLGWRLVDAGAAAPMVADVVAGGPAARAGVTAGERVVAIGGRSVAAVVDVEAAAVESNAGVATEVALVAAGGGAPRSVKIVPVASPLVREPEGATTVERAVAAAFAAVDGAGSADAPAALATLGAILLREGQAGRAIDVLRRVRFDGRPGVGDGTVAYMLGRALEFLGRDEEAREAFSKARASNATAVSDEGPEVGPAAADHLADLGVTAR
jgi:tetratricopeptide (TPR) repeat protein